MRVPYGKAPCTVLKIQPPCRLSFQWTDDWTVTFELAERDGKTEFRLIHSGWKADGVTAFGESHRLVRDRMDQGWGGLLKKLAQAVEA